MSAIHVAGPVVLQVQRCTRCREVISDYRTVGDPSPVGWPAGAHIETDGINPVQSWMTDDAPTCNVLDVDLKTHCWLRFRRHVWGSRAPLIRGNHTTYICCTVCNWMKFGSCRLLPFEDEP